MDKRAKYRKHIEDLKKKLAQSQTEFKKKVQEARRGQIISAEESAKILKPITVALLGKQREIFPPSEEELKKIAGQRFTWNS